MQLPLQMSHNNLLHLHWSIYILVFLMLFYQAESVDPGDLSSAEPLIPTLVGVRYILAMLMP